jgi:hypothetical protein
MPAGQSVTTRIAVINTARAGAVILKILFFKIFI